MCTIISRGIKVAPGPHKRLDTGMHDAVAMKKYGLRYSSIGSRCYRVYLGEYLHRKCLGVVLSAHGSQCWAFVPYMPGRSDRWYLAPTRFEAIDACFNLHDFSSGKQVVSFLNSIGHKSVFDDKEVF